MCAKVGRSTRLALHSWSEVGIWKRVCLYQSDVLDGVVELGFEHLSCTSQPGPSLRSLLSSDPAITPAPPSICTRFCSCTAS
jgi:hypothetical protein